MLTSNALPMLGSLRNGGTRRYHPRGVQDPTATPQRRVIRIDERAEIARDIAAELAPDVIDDIEATYAADDAEWAAIAALDALLYEDERAEADEADLFDTFGLDAGATYDDLAAAVGVTRMGDDRYALDYDDLPGWGAGRVAYEDFKSGFRVTDRP